jgi:hypothetical protein
MSIHLTHSDVRVFAKALRNPTEGTIKHSEIIEDIAGSLGMKPDAMMHFLKSSEKGRGKAAVTADGIPPQGTLRIDEHFTETLSRRLTKRLTGRERLVSTWLVLFILSQTLHRSPDDVYRALRGEENTRPAKRLIYDEFYLRGGTAAREAAREEFKRMFPTYYVRADALEALGRSPASEGLVHTGGGWYRGER